MQIKTLIVLLSLFFATCSYGGVYKCKGNNGHVIFSDTACSAKEREFVDVEALKENQQQKAANITNAPSTVKVIKSSERSYHCDGRTHCSQMTSCAEATFFISNCPNTEMDGNHDGVPCEKQWCK